MPRLRYNGLSAALGASLTNSATSVTFAAALTHSGGTNVPTITGTDYIPLAILDGSGKLSEVVWLTAYTAGATTGTIARGKEGTTGVSHSSGDKVVNAVLIADVPSSPYALDPATLHATYGDHFTGTTLDTGKWTRVGYTTADDWGADGSWLRVMGKAAGNYYYQAAPAGDWSLVGKFTFRSVGAAVMCGLMAVSSTGSGVGAGFYNSSPNGPIVATLVSAAYTSGFQSLSTPLGTVVYADQWPVWIKLTKSGTNYTVATSTNGQSWDTASSALSNAATIARVGFGSFSGTAAAWEIDFFDVQ